MKVRLLSVMERKILMNFSMADFMRAMKGLEKSPDILEEGEEVDLGL